MNMGYSEDYKMSDEELNYPIIGVVLSQEFSLMAGLKKFGNPDEKYSAKEMTHLRDITTFIPLELNKLIREYRIKDLSSLMFLVDKLDGTIKDRTCADGIKQRKYDSYNKHDYASPTCVNNSVVITSALDSKEGFEVAIIYIPGAYLHT